MDRSLYDGSYQQMLMSEDFEIEMSDEGNFNQTSINENFNVVAATRDKKGSRTRNFTHAEDVLIVAAYLNTTKDAIIGNNQQSKTFWGRICKVIEDNGGTAVPRTQLSVKSRWTDINKKCAKFVGYLSKFERLNQSGQTEQGRLVQAQDLYALEMGKPFQYHHCWELLRDDPKWQASLSNKRQRTETSSATDVIVNLEEGNEPTVNEARPLGRKASKELLKEKKGKYTSLLTPEFWEKKEKLDREKSERRERALKQHEKQLELQEKIYEMEIMKVDTTSMGATEAAYYESMKMNILRKKGLDM